MRFRTRKPALVLAAAVVVPLASLSLDSAQAGRAHCFHGDSSHRGLMRGNLDNQGARDEAWVQGRSAQSGGDRCNYYIKVDLGAMQESKVLKHVDRFTMRRYSRIIAMVEVDLVPGKEIGILVAQGANTSFLNLFTIRNGELRRVTIEGKGAPDFDQFAYGGSVGGQVGEDCAKNRPPGEIIYSTAVYKPGQNRYRVKRRWFGVNGTSSHFRRTAEPTDRRTVSPNHIDNFYEFNNAPFRGCMGRVRG